MNNKFNAETLQSLVNNVFKLEAAQGAAFQATLKEVESAPLNGDKWEAFNAVFSVDAGQDTALSETQYKVTHESLGEVTLFGSPNSETELEFCCSFAKED